MDRGQQAAQTNLLDREGRIVAEILERFRNIILVATDRLSNRTSTVGHAAFSAMRMEIETRGLIKSSEDLLTLTRQLRELWVVGPLRKPGEGDQEASDRINASAARVAALLDVLRQNSRAEIVDAEHGAYITAPLEPPRLGGAGVEGSSNSNGPAAAAAVQGAGPPQPTTTTTTAQLGN